MRFAFAFFPGGPIAETVETYRLGEELGYDLAWVMDQTFYPDPFVLLTLVASATQSLALGLGITNPFSRHPAQIARAVAAVDEACGGRLILGLGAGNRSGLLEPLGIDPSRPAQRIREAVPVLRQLLAGQRVHYESPTLTVRGVKLEFTPRRVVPIYIASRGQLSLCSAGELADGAILQSCFTPGALDYALEAIGRGTQRAGRSWEELDLVCWQVVRLTEDRRSALEELGAWAARPFLQGPPPFLRSLGFSPERMETIGEVLRTQGAAAAAQHLTEEELDRFIIVGDADFCAGRVAQLVQRGITTFTLLLRGSTYQVRDTLERFAREALPRFRASPLL